MMENLTLRKGLKTSNAEQRRSQDFHAYELLLLRRLQSDPVICIEWKEKLKKKWEDENYDLGVRILVRQCLTVHLDSIDQGSPNYSYIWPSRKKVWWRQVKMIRLLLEDMDLGIVCSNVGNRNFRLQKCFLSEN